MILLALEYGGNDYPWSDSRVIGLFVGGGATAIVFLAWEYRTGKDAMIPFHLITQRVAYFSYLNMCVLFGLTMVIAYYIPIYFQAVKGDSALTSGVNMLPNILAQLVTAVASGLLSMFPYVDACITLLLLITSRSWEIGILHPLGHWWRYLLRGRHRTPFHALPYNRNCRVGRVPNHPGTWPRCGDTSCAPLLPPLHPYP
jgi:hypothetical protein